MLDVARRARCRSAPCRPAPSAEDVVLDLHVPGVVVLAGLDARPGPPTPRRRRPSSRSCRRRAGSPCGSSGCSSPRTMSPGLKSAIAVRAGADRLEVRRRLTRLRALERLEEVLRDDLAGRAAEGATTRTGVGFLNVILTVWLSILSIFLMSAYCAGRDRRGRRIGRVFPVEDDVVRRERLPVVPLHVPLQLPGDRRAVLRDAAVLERRRLGRQDRHEVAVRVVGRQGLVEDPGAVLVLGAVGEVRIEKSRRPATTAPGPTRRRRASSARRPPSSAPGRRRPTPASGPPSAPSARAPTIMRVNSRRVMVPSFTRSIQCLSSRSSMPSVLRVSEFECDSAHIARGNPAPGMRKRVPMWPDLKPGPLRGQARRAAPGPGRFLTEPSRTRAGPARSAADGAVEDPANPRVARAPGQRSSAWYSTRRRGAMGRAGITSARRSAHATTTSRSPASTAWPGTT